MPHPPDLRSDFFDIPDADVIPAVDSDSRMRYVDCDTLTLYPNLLISGKS
jgi:hypothetical protein